MNIHGSWKVCTINASREALWSDVLVDDHWTKEETDYLFNLVREYDMRFYVVADRYEYPGGQARSLEVASFLWFFKVMRLSDFFFWLLGLEGPILQRLSSADTQQALGWR